MTRRVDLEKTLYYFLTVPNEKRRQYMLNEFKNYNIKEINPITGIPLNKSHASGFTRMLELASSEMDMTKPFKPFVIFEDDASVMRKFPKY